MPELIVLLNDEVVGRVVQDRTGRLVFTYDEQWRERPGAYPLSLSLPLVSAEHPHDAIDAFLWGLLPDNAAILDRWARDFGVSARNAFGLLAHVGEDCAGAVRFARPDDLERLLTSKRGTIQWLTVADIADRLRRLRANDGPGRRPGDVGQFSLAGAQPKTALLLDGDRWGIPSGRTPTTHILKPPAIALDGFAENEHVSLELAHALGLPAARSNIMGFADQIAIVVERYDRLRTDTGWIRVHQEDLCQALGVRPTSKYEAEGGPGIPAIVELLRTYARDPMRDVTTFLDAVALNWLIGGTDAHAKNYSLLIDAGSQVRLAPLYDVVSALPYRELSPYRIKSAMKIGGEYLFRKIGRRQWEKLARQLRLDSDELVARVLAMAEQVPDLAHDVRRRAQARGLHHATLSAWEDTIALRARRCAAALGSGRTTV